MTAGRYDPLAGRQPWPHTYSAADLEEQPASDPRPAPGPGPTPPGEPLPEPKADPALEPCPECTEGPR